MFDVYIEKISDYIEMMRNRGNPIRGFNSPSSINNAEPIRIGSQANPGVILREDTFVELGSPEAGSSAFMLWTSKPSLVKDGKITLIGHDIQESSEQSLPFGQVIMVGGTALDNQEQEKLQQSQFIGDQIEGYMVRSLSQNLWSRVSKEAAGKGFDFATLGRALMAIYKTNNPKIESMEIVFVTSGKDDVSLLNDIAVQVQKIGKELVKDNWKIRGYDLDCALDCSSCVEKLVCDDIREVLREKKKNDALS